MFKNKVARYFAQKNQQAEKRRRLPIPQSHAKESADAFGEDFEESVEDSEKSADGEAIDVKEALTDDESSSKGKSTEKSTAEKLHSGVKSNNYGVFDNYESFF